MYLMTIWKSENSVSFQIVYEFKNDKQITAAVCTSRLLVSSHTSERFCWLMCSTLNKLIFKLCIFPEYWSYIIWYWNDIFFYKKDYKISVSASSGRHSHIKGECLISERCNIHALCLFWEDYHDYIPQG